jgi:hypothetical protein
VEAWIYFSAEMEDLKNGHLEETVLITTTTTTMNPLFL